MRTVRYRCERNPIRPGKTISTLSSSSSSPTRAGDLTGVRVEDVECDAAEIDEIQGDELDEADGNEKDEGELVELQDEAEEDCAPRRTAPDPGQPTAEQIEEHRIDHLPYRCWCEHCVMGRGVGEPHKRGPEGCVPVIAFDYLMITRSGVFTRQQEAHGEIILKILVVEDTRSRYIGADVVSVKGVGADRYAAEKLRNDVLWLGYPKVLLKSDNEPAIVALLKETLKGLKVDAMDAAPVHPPAYDSKANGSVENACRQVQGLLRTLKFCIESRIQRRIPCGHSIMAWLVRHTALECADARRGRAHSVREASRQTLQSSHGWLRRGVPGETAHKRAEPRRGWEVEAQVVQSSLLGLRPA